MTWSSHEIAGISHASADGSSREKSRAVAEVVPFTAAEIAKRKGSRRLKTIHPEQLALALEGKLASVFGYSIGLNAPPEMPPTANAPATTVNPIASP